MDYTLTFNPQKKILGTIVCLESDGINVYSNHLVANLFLGPIGTQQQLWVHISCFGYRKGSPEV